MGNYTSTPAPVHYNTLVYERIAYKRKCYKEDCEAVDDNYKAGTMSIGLVREEKKILKSIFEKEEKELLKLLE